MKFLDYKVLEANFSLTTQLAVNKNYKLTPKINCSIKRGGDRLVCTFNVELKKGEEELPFEFKLTGIGSFSIGAEEDVSVVAVKAAEIVFPFVRSSVASLTQLANMPAYVLPLIDMEELIGKGKIVTLNIPTNLS